MAAAPSAASDAASVADAALAMRPFTRSLPMALLQAREATMRLFRPLLLANGVTEQQWRVLRALAASQEAIGIGDVAEMTFLLGPSLSRIITNLESRGLVERSLVTHDQRRSNLRLSPAGDELVARIAPQSEAVYNQIEADFDEGRLQDLLAELSALTRALELPKENQLPEDPPC